MSGISEMTFDGALTCTLPVAQLAAARRFYESVLGFEHLYTLEERGWCELASPVARVTVGLQQGPRRSGDAVSGAVLNFGVQDIDSARGHFERNGVRFDGATLTIEGVVKLATFFDPDGNKLMLFQELGRK